MKCADIIQLFLLKNKISIKFKKGKINYKRKGETSNWKTQEQNLVSRICALLVSIAARTTQSSSSNWKKDETTWRYTHVVQSQMASQSRVNRFHTVNRLLFPSLRIAGTTDVLR
ncbi:hypothetical protein MTR_2g010015 [Medicago truncatula]|uniref:Uncharacterized protein n=1 Tax=Medicago truncatula TaxID=3880 RepID=A0A072VE75_MEDTR|nr:hypothetical protein MTR_2g010015 [Medicago truncatula]